MLKFFLLENIIKEINNTNIEDKNCWKFTSADIFSVKSSTWAKNTNIKPYQKAKFFNSLWSLNLRFNLQIFIWKSVRNLLPTRGKLKTLDSWRLAFLL